jgi:hypothetical protein
MPPKNSYAGPVAAVTELDLNTVLLDERQAYEGQTVANQPTLDNAVRTWGHLYHALVWLAAAKDPPGPNTLLELDQNNEAVILPNSYLVPAFTASEGGSDTAVRGGLIFNLTDRYGQNDDNQNSPPSFNPNGGLLFKEEAYQNYVVDNVTQPLLQHVLDKFRALRDASGLDPLNFDDSQLLTDCQDSAQGMNFHSSTANFINAALARIKELWGANITAELPRVNGWADAQPVAGGSRPWLDAQLGIANLNIFGFLLGGASDDDKKLLATARLALALNRDIYGFVFNRFVDLDDGSLKSDGLEQVIAIVTSQLSNAEKQLWSQLLAVSYGVVAKKIFDQTEVLVDSVKQILP